MTLREFKDQTQFVLQPAILEHPCVYIISFALLLVCLPGAWEQRRENDMSLRRKETIGIGS